MLPRELSISLPRTLLGNFINGQSAIAHLTADNAGGNSAAEVDVSNDAIGDLGSPLDYPYSVESSFFDK